MEKLQKEGCKELFIDVSGYEYPIPFEKVMQLLSKMNKGEYIRMHHRKKPLPLIQLLQESGFDCIVHQGSDIPWEIIIWFKNDTGVDNYCLTQFPD